MTNTMTNRNDQMLTRLFFNMLPIQILIFAVGSINSIVDGSMAGRFIGSNAVGIIGLYYPMVNIMTAAGSVLLGGTAVICGMYMGKGNLKKTDGIFSLNMTVTLILGVILTAASIIFPGLIAAALGASDDLKQGLMLYIVSYAIGIIPMLLGQQLAAFLQMERQNDRGYIGIAGMSISNILLDILLVGIMRQGMWGLGLATSLSNVIYCLILITHYFTSKAQFHFSTKNIPWNELPRMIRIGFPGALLVFCLAIRDIVINRLLIQYAGSDGLPAKSAHSMVSGFFIAYCLGNGAVVRMLISVFVGEEDKHSMRKTLKLVLTKGLALSVLVTAVVIAISGPLVTVFFPDKSTVVYHSAYQLFVIYALCIPFILICQIITNYLQATGHNMYVNFVSVFDGFFSMVIPSVILAPVLGALGVWLANPIGIFLTILTAVVYCIIYWKHFPKTIDECMFIKPGFGLPAKDILNISIRSMDEVALSSVRVQEFCEEHSLEKKTAYYAALSLEEMAGNVISHGFNADKKSHSVTSMVMYKSESVVLRIKDDCIPFNPTEMADIMTGENNYDNLGIRMILKIADNVTYQNLLGLNVLTIVLKDEDLVNSIKDDYLLERTLHAKDKNLHTIFRDTVFATQNILNRFELLFPEYTDHSELHSMTVIDSCNRLIGRNQIDMLNADEIYTLLTACYLHDVGMGVSEKDFDEFKVKLGNDEFFASHPGATKADFVRTYHNEFSGLFLDKYYNLFDIPSKEHLFAIKQIVRGHRKTDLYDEKEYPADFKVPNGNTICLPYLAALLRLADEVDVVASRNPLILYDIDILTDEVEIVENKKLQAIKSMRMTRNAYVFTYKTYDDNINKELIEMIGKMQKTLDYCRDVAEKRTPFSISQEKITLRREQ